ncbi:hypothetical protein RUND412_010733 [Rhizina undulata]
MGSTEYYNDKIVAQQFAQMLAQVRKQLVFNRGIKSQEAFVFSMHGTLLHIAIAFFPKEYIACIRSNTPLPADQFLYFRRSKAFDFTDPEQRVETLQLTLGVFRYIKSGQALVATAQCAWPSV